MVPAQLFAETCFVIIDGFDEAFRELAGRWPDSPKGRTRREIIAMQKKLPVFRGEGIAKRDLSEADALALAESLPPPTFDADRRLRDLDKLA